MGRINRFTTKQLITESMNIAKAQDEKAMREFAVEDHWRKEINNVNESIINAKKSRTDRQNARSRFALNIKESLVTECIFKVYKESFGIELKNDYSSVMRKNLVGQFVRENGADNLLRQFRTGSVLLSEFAYLIDNTYNKIMEEYDANDPDCMLDADFARIDPQLTDDFFDKLDDEDTGTASAAIKQRVADAITEFIDQNIGDKQDIKDVLSAAQEKIDNTSDSALKESYQSIATRKVNDIRGRKKNVFGAMVQSMCEAVMKSDQLKSEFMSEGTLDMDLIVERVTTLYTFIESLNTMKIINVDEQYVDELISSLKTA